ncbi:MAG: proprotein convertase P-domain-containing protein, partial [Myxococcales bacterium]|nr:proprotein convertase P-domain-containing protein [Myxococcales bacterium]
DTPLVLGAPPIPRWIGDGEPDPGAGYAWSALSVTEPGAARRARLAVDIDHTYRGDLTLTLVTPKGAHLWVEHFSGSDNDVHETFDVTLPDDTEQQGTWHLLVADRAGLDVGTIDAWSLEFPREGKGAEGKGKGEGAGAPEGAKAPKGAKTKAGRRFASTDVPVFIPDAPDGAHDEGLALIEVETAPIDTLAARYGRVGVDAQTGFARLELEAAPQLRPLPKHASVVFVVDASHSAAPVSEQLALVRAYMAHVPDAKAEVVLFRRFAERVTGDFLAPEALWPALERAQAEDRFEPGNGSALDEGLSAAAAALRERRGPRRIVVLTDARLRSRFTVADGLAALRRAPRSTIAHVVVPESGSGEVRLVRADDHALAPIPAASGGVLFGLEGAGSAELKALEPAALALVRPISIDHFALDGIELADAPELPEVFAEGSAYGFMINAPHAPGRLTVRGKIWGRDFEREVRSTRAFGDATAAFVFSEDEHHDLTPEQMMKVALRGRAVSPVTSYLATEPGVRPSTIGLETSGSGFGSGAGTLGLGMAGLIGRGGGGASARRWTLEELIEGGVQACVAAHHPAEGWRVELSVETTSQEIVDVEAVSGSGALTECVVEAAWAVQLTWNFTAERAAHKLSVP